MSKFFDGPTVVRDILLPLFAMGVGIYFTYRFIKKRRGRKKNETNRKNNKD